MSRTHWCLFALAALSPLSIQVHTSGDTLATVVASDGTRFEVMAGTGEYAFITRGCEGQVLSQVPASFRDAGARVEHDFGHGLSLGVRGGVVRDDIAANTDPYQPIQPVSPTGTGVPERLLLNNTFVNPYFSYAKEHGSVGLGWVWHEHEFITAGEESRTKFDHPLNDISAHIRLGTERRYFAARWMEGVPLASSGGYLTLGFGGRPGGKPIALYGGLGTGGPYEGAGLVLQASYPFHNGITTSVRSRIGLTTAGRSRSGVSRDQNASGVAIGVGYGVFAP